MVFLALSVVLMSALLSVLWTYLGVVTLSMNNRHEAPERALGEAFSPQAAYVNPTSGPMTERSVFPAAANVSSHKDPLPLDNPPQLISDLLINRTCDTLSSNTSLGIQKIMAQALILLANQYNAGKPISSEKRRSPEQLQ